MLQKFVVGVVVGVVIGVVIDVVAGVVGVGKGEKGEETH